VSAIHRLVLAAAAAMLFAGCSLLPSPPSSDYDILVGNGTTLDVAIRVNGSVREVVAAGQGATVSAASIGPLPWRVEAVTAGGRVLVAMDVAPGGVWCRDTGGGSRECQGFGGRADLSCGRLDLSAALVPLSGPAPGPGVPGDCLP
jgi:hypothetical protein